MVCKGICLCHKAIMPKTGQRYLIGQKLRFVNYSLIGRVYFAHVVDID